MIPFSLNQHLSGVSFSRSHSINLDTDTPLANHNPAILSVPQALENLKSPPWHTKTLIIPICYTFNKKTYTDVRTAYKHILVPSYSSGLTEPKCHNLVNWFFSKKKPRSTVEIKPSKSYFILQSFVDTRNAVSTTDKYLWQELFKSPPRLSFFSVPPFIKGGGGTDTVEARDIVWNFISINIYFSFDPLPDFITILIKYPCPNYRYVGVRIIPFLYLKHSPCSV